MSSLLRGLDGSAIVYVMTKKDAEQLAVDVRDFVLPVWPCATTLKEYQPPTRVGFRYFAECSPHALKCSGPSPNVRELLLPPYASGRASCPLCVRRRRLSGLFELHMAGFCTILDMLMYVTLPWPALLFLPLLLLCPHDCSRLGALWDPRVPGPTTAACRMGTGRRFTTPSSGMKYRCLPLSCLRPPCLGFTGRRSWSCAVLVALLAFDGMLLSFVDVVRHVVSVS